MFERYFKKRLIRQNINTMLSMKCQYCMSTPGSTVYMPSEASKVVITKSKSRDGEVVDRMESKEIRTPQNIVLKCDRHCIALMLQAKNMQYELDNERR